MRDKIIEKGGIDFKGGIILPLKFGKSGHTKYNIYWVPILYLLWLLTPLYIFTLRAV